MRFALNLLALCAAARAALAPWLDVVVVGAPPPPLLLLAAQQVRRYVHALDRRLPLPSVIVAANAGAVARTLRGSSARVALVLAAEAEGGGGSDAAPTVATGGAFTVAAGGARGGAAMRVDIFGGDARGQGALFGAISVLRALGVGFGADGPPTLPPTAAARAAAATAGVALGADSAAAAAAAAALVAAAAPRAQAPAFEYRGFQPWGSYPIGNDWWDVDEYRRVVELIVGLRGNWIGMHNYGVNYGNGTEPGVWIGADAAAVAPSGNVTAAYRSAWSSTERGLWGFGTTPTGNFSYGAAPLFEHDCYGNGDVLSGDAALCPYPVTPAAEAEMFNRVGAVYASAFALAAELGVSTALGTEMPLSVPPPGKDALVPLLMWWSPVRDDTFVTTTQCAECPADAQYEMIGVAGFVFAGPGDGRVALDCYWDAAALDAWTGVGAPPSPAYGFVRTEGYAAPPGASGAPVSLFQVARNFSKAGVAGPAIDTWAVAGGAALENATARGYTPSGGAAPIASLFAPPPPSPADPLVAAYTATFTRLARLYGANLTWYWAWTPEAMQWDKWSQHNPVVVAMLADLEAMVSARDAASAPFGLALGGWQLGPFDNRTFFDAHAPPSFPLASLDGYLGDSPPDAAFGAVRRAQKWSFVWAEDDEALTAPQQWVGRNLAHAAAALAMNVTGHASLQWRTRTSSPQLTAVADFAWNTSLTTADFLGAWALAQFGESVAAAAAAILVRVDSDGFPRPIHCDPGCLRPNAALCLWPEVYAWVDDFAALRPRLLAASTAAGADVADADAACLERFDYWLNQYEHARGMAAVQCDWAAFDATFAAVSAMPDGPARRAAAVARVFPAFASLVANTTAMVTSALAATATNGDLGVLAQLVDYAPTGAGPQAAVAALAGVPLPPACVPPTGYAASRLPLLRVLTVRTLLDAGERLRLRAVLLAGRDVLAGGCAVTAFARLLGGAGPFEPTPLARAAPEAGIARAVWAATLAPPSAACGAGSGCAGAADFEWYVTATCAALNATLFFPPDAPALPQTVVVLPPG